MICPLTKEQCTVECAWYAEEQCAFSRLHEISNSLDEISNSLDEIHNILITLDDTIANTNFSE